MTYSVNPADRQYSVLKTSSFSVLLQRLFKSDAFLYPIFGVQYFLSHRSYWPSFAKLFIPLASIYLVVLQLLFISVFPIYLFFATLVLGPVGIVQAFIFVFQITGKISNLVVKVSFFSKLQVKTFDQVLIENGFQSIIDEYNESQVEDTESAWKAFTNWLLTKAWPSLMKEVLHAIIFSFPFIGPFLHLYIKSRGKAAKVHERYHKLAQLSEVQKELHFSVFQRDYTAYGYVAMFLETIPLFSFFFMFTNNIGMALWTADNKGRLLAAKSVPCD